MDAKIAELEAKMADQEALMEQQRDHIAELAAGIDRQKVALAQAIDAFQRASSTKAGGEPLDFLTAAALPLPEVWPSNTTKHRCCQLGVAAWATATDVERQYAAELARKIYILPPSCSSIRPQTFPDRRYMPDGLPLTKISVSGTSGKGLE